MAIKYKPVQFTDIKFFVEQEMERDRKIIFGCHGETETDLLLFVMFDVDDLKTGSMMSCPKLKIVEHCENNKCIIFSHYEFNERYPNYKNEYAAYVKKNNIKPDPSFKLPKEKQ
jgi:hypothetical protein